MIVAEYQIIFFVQFHLLDVYTLSAHPFTYRFAIFLLLKQIHILTFSEALLAIPREYSSNLLCYFCSMLFHSLPAGILSEDRNEMDTDKVNERI